MYDKVRGESERCGFEFFDNFQLRLTDEMGYYESLVATAKWAEDYALTFFRKPYDKHE